MQDLRRPPLHHHERSGGVCRWCGLIVFHDKGAKAGEPNRRRAWHTACVDEYKLHAWAAEQEKFVRKRDGGRCAACRERPKKWVRAKYESTDRATRGRYVRIKRACALELDHLTPLWSVANLPAHERRAFFGPSNLQLLCPDCHRAKTTREAAERAGLRRKAA